jgi:hypothetical protein
LAYQEGDFLLIRQLTEQPFQKSGLIVSGGGHRAVVIDPMLLVFDSDSWARGWVKSAHTAADEAMEENNRLAAINALAEAQVILEWLTNHADVARLDSLLHGRFSLTPHVVRKDTLHSYVAKATYGCVAPQESDKPEFLLMMDGNAPTLYTLTGMVALHQNTGPDIIGVPLHQSALRRRVAGLCKHTDIGDTMIPRRWRNAPAVPSRKGRRSER